MCGFKQQSMGETARPPKSHEVSNFGTRKSPGFETHGIPCFWTKKWVGNPGKPPARGGGASFDPSFFHYNGLSWQKLHLNCWWHPSFQDLIYISIPMSLYICICIFQQIAVAVRVTPERTVLLGCCDFFAADCRLWEHKWKNFMLKSLQASFWLMKFGWSLSTQSWPWIWQPLLLTDSFMILLINAYHPIFIFGYFFPSILVSYINPSVLAA